MSEFHFLRPLWLVCTALLIISWVYYRLNRKNKGTLIVTDALAPHLAKALTPKQSWRQTVFPLDWVGLFAVILSLALAGPAWYKTSQTEHQSPYVFVLKVSESMQADDISPNRLTRAKHKIQDTLALSPHRPSALIAYHKSAHQVLPLTDDAQLYPAFLAGLNVDVMPSNTSVDDALNQALKLAKKTLSTVNNGHIIVLSDDINDDVIASLNQDKTRFIWWQFATPQGASITDQQGNLVTDKDGQVKRVYLNPTTLNQLQHVSALTVTSDDKDIRSLFKITQADAKQAQLDDDKVPFIDTAKWFVVPLMGLCLLGFRKGWTLGRHVMHTMLVCVVSLNVFMVSTPVDASVVDYFFSKDQQAMWAFKNKEYEKAAALFDDPMWRGTALYENGDYEAAAKAFSQVEGVDGMFNRANALFKSFQYQNAMVGYQQVLAISPNHSKATHNLALAKAAFEKVTAQLGKEDLEQNQSSQVDDAKLSQSSSNEFKDYEASQSLSVENKEKWMRSLNHDMSEFLATKFSAQVNQEQAQ